jgi:hypothetical protein
MSFFRFFGMPQVALNPEVPFNVHQQQTQGDRELAEEARHIVKVLSNPRVYTGERHLRAAVGNNQADYLYTRFATALGWKSLGDAQQFYNQHKGTRGGTY